jgi:soluble lytic murein transglycosylase-like protein
MKFLFISCLFLLSLLRYAQASVVDKVCHRMKYEDCALVKAIIKYESSGNPLAVGHDGAGSLGLMQVKCSTARMLDNFHGRKPIRCRSLFNPTINIKTGIEYLRYIEQRLTIKPTVYELLSVYNGGYFYDRKDNTYIVKTCNAISIKKKRRCKQGHEPFNIEYSKNVIKIYNKIKGV